MPQAVVVVGGLQRPEPGSSSGCWVGLGRSFERVVGQPLLNLLVRGGGFGGVDGSDWV